ncbi:MAG: class I SAM-dependent methyltransferase [Sphaerochaeta sp.]
MGVLPAIKNVLLTPLVPLVIKHPSLQESWWFLLAMKRFPSSIAKTYDQRLTKDGVAYQEPIRKALENVQDSPSSLLDLCCGTGIATILARHQFPEASITAVDQSKEMIQLCRQKVQEKHLTAIHLEVADARALPYSDETFSLVLSSNAPVYLKEAVRVLKSRGTLIYTFSFAGRPFEKQKLPSFDCLLHILWNLLT